VARHEPAWVDTRPRGYRCGLAAIGSAAQYLGDHRSRSVLEIRGAPSAAGQEARVLSARKGSNWFVRPTPGVDAEEQWRSDVQLLVEMHGSMREAVSQLGPGDLGKVAVGGKTTILSLVTGIAAHDLYHAGQIQLLKRLHAEESASAKRA